MLRVVTSNNTAIFRELRSPSFQALEVEHSVVIAGDEALAKIRADRPDLAVLDVDLPELSGYEVCRAIKDDPDLSSTRVVLVISGGLLRGGIERLAESRCDDVHFVATAAENLYARAARILDLPQTQRTSVRAQLLLESGRVGGSGAVVRGVATAIGHDAVVLTAERMVPLGQEVGLRLGRAGSGQSMQLSGTVVGCERDDEYPGPVVRVRLAELEDDQARRIADLALWEVIETSDGVVVLIRGDITEKTDFEPLLAQLGPRDLQFDMGGCRYFNSTGIRRWVELLERIDPDATYRFVRCSVAFVTQLGLVERAMGRGEVVSFMAPYYCEICDRESQRLLLASELELGPESPGSEGPLVPVPPAEVCSACDSALEFDDIPERFFAFMQTA